MLVVCRRNQRLKEQRGEVWLLLRVQPGQPLRILWVGNHHHRCHERRLIRRRLHPRQHKVDATSIQPRPVGSGRSSVLHLLPPLMHHPVQRILCQLQHSGNTQLFVIRCSTQRAWEHLVQISGGATPSSVRDLAQRLDGWGGTPLQPVLKPIQLFLQRSLSNGRGRQQ
jgi:hypothetical protein